MSIAPLAILGAVNTAFSLVGSLAQAMKRPALEVVPGPQTAPMAQESLWHQLGKNIDVHALTKDELAQVSQILYQHGAIDLHTHALLTTDSTSLLTSSALQGQVDWMAEFQARLEHQLQKGDLKAAEHSNQALDVLALLQMGGRGLTSIRV